MPYIRYHYLDEYPDHMLKYVVIVSRYRGQWVLCRHRERATWEIPGGHIEPGESALDAARRELFEETGATRYELTPVNIYAVKGKVDYTMGLLCFAELWELGAIPEGSEIAEVAFFDALPQALTYPMIQPYLFAYTDAWQSVGHEREEYWDMYDADRRMLGKVHCRADLIPDGEYHIVVHAWVKTRDGRILLTQRSPCKGFPHLWECSGGSVLTGEDSLTAAVREIREETGLSVPPSDGVCVKTIRRVNDFLDIWLFHADVDMTKIRLCEGETCDAMLVDLHTLQDMRQNELLAPYSYLDELFLKSHRQD
ncbi:MAG: NUDIX domain-containing protein [Clostridia bacterium]|nr:NUDIX domain-containing protein [Clostridia bacterium]